MSNPINGQLATCACGVMGGIVEVRDLMSDGVNPPRFLIEHENEGSHWVEVVEKAHETLGVVYRFELIE